MRFRFLHAADVHLDSPLIGLRQRAEAYAGRLEDASRRAFDNLVALAIEEKCQLVVIAGDVFDGPWRDYRTGLFFADRMRRLRQAGVAVVMIAGNHDAENPFAGRLQLSDNVRLLSARFAETVTFDQIGVAVHGRSFPQREVRDNIARNYPRPLGGRFNIGLLHTACTGRDGHEPYAPCTLEQLANHGYQYWALGHVHAREVLSTEPPIVFPGNLQGRNIRETGPKGATLVEVEDGRATRIEHQSLDLIRWAVVDVDISVAENRADALFLVREAIEGALSAAHGRGLAARIRLLGTSRLQIELTATETSLGEEIEMLAASVSGDVWIERTEIRTEPPQPKNVLDPSVGGRIRQRLEELARDPWLLGRLQARLTEIRAKIPPGARPDALIASLEAEAVAQAQDVALAALERDSE